MNKPSKKEIMRGYYEGFELLMSGAAKSVTTRANTYLAQIDKDRYRCIAKRQGVKLSFERQDDHTIRITIKGAA